MGAHSPFSCFCPVLFPASSSLLSFHSRRFFVTPHITGPFFSTSQQLGGDPQSWTEVYAVLKGTSLFCYHRQEDVEANVEPAFTIAVNKVSKGKHRKMGDLCKTFYFWRSIHPRRTYTLCFWKCLWHFEPRCSRIGIVDCCQFSSTGRTWAKRRVNKNGILVVTTIRVPLNKAFTP